jgi:hypothetical protein
MLTYADVCRQIISQQFKEAMGKRNINALVFDLTNMEIADTSVYIWRMLTYAGVC